MGDTTRSEYVETLVIGGGQSGLAVGYHLAQRGVPYLIVDANERIGDAWRNRWDSFRLFTPNRLNALPGMKQPGFHWRFPSKDEMADYLVRYAETFDLRVRNGVRIDRLTRHGERFVALTGDTRLEADHVVVAMSSWQVPKVPPFADQLDPATHQLTSAEYANPDQLPDGTVLVVGVGNSGAEIALELSRTRHVLLAGEESGVIPFRPESVPARLMMPLVGRVVFHRVLTRSTPLGRKARPKMRASGEPLLRVKPKDLEDNGVERVARVAGVTGGRPVLADGRELDVEAVVWCTGFHPGFSWIDLPVFGDDPTEPDHQSGIVEGLPGLYFVGLKFLHSVSSEQIHGVGRDAERIAEAIEARRAAAAEDLRLVASDRTLESA